MAIVSMEFAALRADLPRLRWLGHPGASMSLGDLPRGSNSGGEVAIAVGPEGGFTAEEVGMAVAAGWTPVDLGPRILRVETAALVLVARAAL